MGNWHISVEGLGSHHNNWSETDADRLATEFVELLKSKGHLIKKASFTFGGSTDLMPNDDEPSGAIVGRPKKLTD